METDLSGFLVWVQGSDKSGLNWFFLQIKMTMYWPMTGRGILYYDIML